MIPFHYLVIATGGTYGAPLRNQQNIFIGDRLDHVKEMQNRIKLANSVLVVGGGPAGMELVGEIRHLYPDKMVGIMQK